MRAAGRSCASQDGRVKQLAPEAGANITCGTTSLRLEQVRSRKQGAFLRAAARREIVGQLRPVFSKRLAIPVKIRSHLGLALVLR